MTVAVSCLTVFALAAGFRSTIADTLFSSHDGLPAPVATSSATTTAAPTGSAPPAANAGTASATTAAPTTAGPPATPPQQPGSLADVAQALLEQLNAWRAAEGKAPLTMASGLVASAHKHNLLMAAGCGMMHQCPAEASLGSRISAEGIAWQAVAENIAWHSSVSGSGVLAAAKGLNESMYGETPPDDGHRRNMLSDAYHRIGIDVIRDATGQVWLTEDFAN